MIEETIYTLLTTIATDVYFNHAPHADQKNSLIIFRGIASTYSKENWCDSDYQQNKRIQVDSYDTNALRAKQTLYAALTKLNQALEINSIEENPDDIDEETKLHRSSADIQIKTSINLS